MRVLAVLALVVFAAGAGQSVLAEQQLAHLGDPASTGRAESVHAKGAADRGRSPLLSVWEREQVADLVRKQLAAVAQGNAQAAYDFLTPDAQTFYAHPEAFLFAIGQQTKPIADVRGFIMAGIEQDPLRAFQVVYLTDSEGQEWLARFQVERQPGAAGWRVKRCFVEPVDGGRA